MLATLRRTAVPSVVTDTDTEVGLDPVSVTELEDMEPVDPVGAPLQLRVHGLVDLTVT